MSLDWGTVCKEVAPIAKELVASYAQKGNVDNLTWLKVALSKNKSTASQAADIAEGIVSGVQKFSANMRKIDQACAAGKTKEKWLASQVESSVNLTEQQKGEYLAQANAALKLGSKAMVDSMQTPETLDITQEVNQLNQQDLPPIEGSSGQSNRFTRKPIINEIGQQAELMGANGAQMSIDKVDVEGAEILPPKIIDEPCGSKFDEGVKMAAAAALKIGIEMGKVPFLPKSMPIDAVTTIACVGVETFKNISGVATGKVSKQRAMENIGRASIVAFSIFCTTGIPAQLLKPIPVAGPILSYVVGEFLRQCSPEDIQRAIYAGIEMIKPLAQRMAANTCRELQIEQVQVTKVVKKTTILQTQ